jgi:hypothetical protein
MTFFDQLFILTVAAAAGFLAGQATHDRSYRAVGVASATAAVSFCLFAQAAWAWVPALYFITAWTLTALPRRAY